MVMARGWPHHSTVKNRLYRCFGERKVPMLDFESKVQYEIDVIYIDSTHFFLLRLNWF